MSVDYRDARVDPASNNLNFPPVSPQMAPQAHPRLNIETHTHSHSQPTSPQVPFATLAPQGFTAPFPQSTQAHSSQNAFSSSQTAQLGRHLSARRHSRKRSSTIYVQPRQFRSGSEPIPEESTTESSSGLLKGASTLAAAQLLSKLLAFALNQLLIRFLGARDLGAASQLDLLLSTSFSLSREALRLASQRQSVSKNGNINEYTTDGRAVLDTVIGSFQETVNLGWLAAVIGGSLLSFSTIVLYWYDVWPRSALIITGVAAAVELAIEPCFLLMQRKLEFSQRARAESAANIARVFAIALFLIIFQTTPFSGFALGHLSYSLALAVFYLKPNLKAASETGYSLYPAKVWTNQLQQRAVFIGDTAWRTSWELGIQQVIKYFLTEGDKLAVSLMTTLEEQGEYALAGNYGSLLARLLFLPVEDALRGYFTQILPKSSNEPAIPLDNDSCTTLDNNSKRNSRSLSVSDENSSTSSDSDEDRSFTEPKYISEDGIEILSTVLRTYAYLGILASGFGSLVVGYLISFVIRTSKFGNAVHVLAAYMCYIPVLAWNGSLDALVQSVASLETLRKQGFVLAGLALCFIFLTYLFVSVMGMGAVGLVWAQVVGMSLRTAWSLQFATAYFGKGYQWLRLCTPPWWVIAVALFNISIARLVVGEATRALHFFIIASLAAIVVGTGLFAERQQVIALYEKIRSNRKKATIDTKNKYE